ncbi:MAG: thiamine-phosphate kinase [Vicinamibacteria bacterium]|nr:thiamine-phosphate kinase [Vicinamibacteria bacterium]
MSDIGEKAILRHIRSRIPSWGVGLVLGVGDDAAVVETGPRTLVTTDSLVEGIDFRSEWTPPTLLGRRVLTINASDIAAMGGVPRHATVSLCLRPDVTFGFVDAFYDGLLERCAELGINLIGGNLSATHGSIVIDVTLIGEAHECLLRSGALAGDCVAVTGTLGAAAAGARLLTQGARLNAEGGLSSTGLWTESSSAAVLHCLRANLDPAPPLTVARSLAERGFVHAAIDLSDGLSGDLMALCAESNLSAWIDPERIPLNQHAVNLERARGGDALALALHGGDDYQLLVAVPAEKVEDAVAEAMMWDVKLTCIGGFEAGEPLVSLKMDQTLTALSCVTQDHFKGVKRPG